MKKINLRNILIVAAVIAIVADLSKLYLNVREIKKNGNS